MTNDQRMVDVGLLEYALRVIELSTPDYEDWRTQADKLRAIIDGPGVEPVAYLYKVLTIGKGLSTEFAAIEYHLQDGEKLIWKKPLYLAAPSAPVPSDDQGPLDKSRLKRLVTQVFGEGWHIIPPSAPAHNETAELCAWRSRFPQFEYRPQDECVALRIESDKPAAPVQATPVAYHDKDQLEGIAWCPGYPEKLKDISPLYTLAPVQAVPDWQPIETAPKDGSVFLAFTADFSSGVRFNCLVQEARWSGTSPYDLAGHFQSRNGQIVTHWMPLRNHPRR